MKMHPYSTHQALLVAALAHTDGPIIELGGGWYSTPLISSFSVASARSALTVETGSYVFDLLRGLQTPHHRIVLLGGFDFDQVGKFAAQPGRGIPDYKRLQADYFDTLPALGLGRVSVAFVDQAPGFLRAPAIEFFADKADFIITHDTEHTEHYHFEPLLSSFKYRWDFTVHRPQSVVVSNRRDCSIFAYLGMVFA